MLVPTYPHILASTCAMGRPHQAGLLMGPTFPKDSIGHALNLSGSSSPQSSRAEAAAPAGYTRLSCDTSPCVWSRAVLRRCPARLSMPQFNAPTFSLRQPDRWNPAWVSAFLLPLPSVTASRDKITRETQAPGIPGDILGKHNL